jgi:hypothetical protein
LAPAEVWRLRSQDGPEFERVEFSEDRSALFSSVQGLGCFLFESRQEGMTYLEMVHPSDFTATELSAEHPAGYCRMSHRLFGGSLEKGVILRSRVRGILLPASSDFEEAHREYLAFVGADLPLTA